MHILKSLFLLGVAFMASGCMQLGPGALKASRLDYNIAIQHTNEQELLLNLVRLRYRDAIYFLDVDKVASTLEFSRSLASTYTMPEKGSNTLTLGAANVAFAEKPTIFYSPIEGERFAKQMMSTINPDILILMTNSGWSIERVLAVALQEMNGLKNAPSATGPTPSYEPIYKEFRQALKHLRVLQKKKLLEAGRVSDDGNKDRMELHMLPAAANDPDALEFKRLLGIDPEVADIHIKAGLGHGGKDTINILPRSMIGILNYLSQGVNPPPQDVEKGRVTRTLADNGETFDWQAVLGGLFSVASSGSEPSNAAVAVNYRGSWFYVSDDDLETKSTFSLLTLLLALQAGPQGISTTPVSFSISR